MSEYEGAEWVLENSLNQTKDLFTEETLTDALEESADYIQFTGDLLSGAYKH